MKEWEAIFWDFDGVLMNSNSVRDRGFELVLSDYPKEEVLQLMKFHQSNGGLSRYVKFRYFFEQIRGEQITEEEVNKWAARFSDIMLANLLDSRLLISESLNYVKRHYFKTPMHIVSGSDQEELRTICQTLDISKYFQSIHGSPRPKKEWVAQIIDDKKYSPTNCVLIGDSINDYEAAIENGLNFMGYNNPKVESISTLRIEF